MMRTRILISVLLIVGVAFTSWANEDGHGRGVEDVEQEIRGTLGLGDAVMREVHPDPDQHEWMGRMMGSGWGLMGNPQTAYGDIPSATPEDILKRRYAAGEISRSEYRRMVRTLDE